MCYLTGGEDYKVGPYSVTFPTNTTSVFMENLLNDDDIVEMDEYFNLTIDTSSLPIGVYASDPYHTRVIIHDDDSKWIYIFICLSACIFHEGPSTIFRLN